MTGSCKGLLLRFIQAFTFEHYYTGYVMSCNSKGGYLYKNKAMQRPYLANLTFLVGL